MSDSTILKNKKGISQPAIDDDRQSMAQPPSEQSSSESPCIPYIEPGCISCGSCAYNAPEVFEVTDRSRIRQNADFEKNRALIEKAAALCPVSVIKIKQNQE